MSYRQIYPDLKRGEYTFSVNKALLDLQYVYHLLCIPSRYSTGLPPERFPMIIKNSICFGLYYQGKQVGFARVITDYSEFASIWDVIIAEEHRGKGLGKALMKYILNHAYLEGIFRWFLMTEDAHKLYQKFGFKSESYNPYIMMKMGTN